MRKFFRYGFFVLTGVVAHAASAFAFDWQAVMKADWAFANPPPAWNLKVHARNLEFVSESGADTVDFQIVSEESALVILLTRTKDRDGKHLYRYEVLCQSGGALYEFTGKQGWEIPPQKGDAYFGDVKAAKAFLPMLPDIESFNQVEDCTKVQAGNLIRLDYKSAQ